MVDAGSEGRARAECGKLRGRGEIGRDRVGGVGLLRT